MQEIPSSIKPYLDEIAQCLSDRNASIMVGAGFSMNAKPVFENAKKFPSWQDLGNIFYEKARGEKISEAKYNFFDPLKLAYEVESNFGRPVLDSLLRANIPDSDYKPSELHHSLLSLPWTDVFTTNYDTLLERAADSVNERNYKVVVHKDNLVHSTPPRIFKLHGCFSASTPLIISEEDYRVYPQKFAPFVNTVQQTLLENTLCLIGFSGDDPNFLKWVGWIRDNLGMKNSPKIYLIGVLNLSTSQERALAQYNITCVDMSLCESVREKDHCAGIAEFINYCKARTDYENKVDWKLLAQQYYPKRDSTGKLDVESLPSNLMEVTKLWKSERRSYPNWLVVPHDLRKNLWNYTRDWASVFYINDPLPLSILRDFVYEFLWRKEKSLLPIFDNEVDLIWSTIETELSKDRVEDSNVFYIALSLIRYYREEGKKDAWHKLFNTLEAKFDGPVDTDYLTYEKALYLLMENNGVELSSLLTKWGSGGTSAIWMYRKAGLLAETNNLGNARDTLEKALIKTRRKINADASTIDYANVSLESYILVLLTNVNLALSISSGSWLPEPRQEYRDRLSELQQFKCNPWQEMEFLRLEIKHEPTPSKDVSVTNGFDIGSQRTTRHFSVESGEVLNAFRLLRFFEDAALPFSLPRVNIAVAEANDAIKRIATHAPYWSMVTMLRTRDRKSIELIFTRESLDGFDSHFVDGLAKRYIELLTSFINEKSSLYEYGLVLPEAISRLCCKASQNIKDEVLNLLIKIYTTKITRNKYQSLDSLLKRLLSSFSDEDIISRIDKIIELSSYSLSQQEFDSHLYPNPFKFIYFSQNLRAIAESRKIKLSNDNLRSFFESLESTEKHVREDASFTLIFLKDIGALNKTQIKSLLSRLLVQTDEYGLPKNTLFFKFAFIRLFEGDEKIKQAFRSYLSDFHPLVQVNESNPKSYGLTGAPDPYTNEIVGCSEYVTFTHNEQREHAEKLITWWNLDKVIFKNEKKDSNLFEEMRCRFSLYVDAIDIIVVKNNILQYKDIIEETVLEFEELGLDSLSLKAAALEYLAYEEETLANQIESALSSFEQHKVLDALSAISKRLRISKSTRSPYERLLATFIRFSRGQHLIQAFQVVINILKEDSRVISLCLESAVLIALDYVSKGFEQLDFEENLALRKIAARLSNELHRHYLRIQKPIPSEISKWKILCSEEDEFAEIKNEWVGR